MGLRSFLKKAIRVAAPIAGAVFGGPIGGAIGGAIGARVAGRSATQGALTGALLGPAAVSGFGALRSGASIADIGRTIGTTLTAGGRLSPLLQASPPGAPALPQASSIAMGGQLVPVGFGGGQLMDDSGRLIQTGALGLGARAITGTLGGLTRMAGNLVMSAAGRIRGVIGLGGQFLTARRVFSGAQILGLAGASAALGITVDEVAQIVLQESTRRRGRARGITAVNLRTTKRVTGQIIRMGNNLRELCGQGGFVRRGFSRARSPRVIAVKQ